MGESKSDGDAGKIRDEGIITLQLFPRHAGPIEDKHSFRNCVLVKLTDLKDLRVIKKNLEPSPAPTPTAPPASPTSPFDKSQLYVFCTPDNSSGKIDNRPFGKSSDLCIS